MPNFKVHIETDPSFKPIKVPPQFIPLRMKNATKEKLDKWEADGIIRKVTQHDFITWISSLYPVEKATNKSPDEPLTAQDVRLTINCRNVNHAIIREPHTLLPDQRQVEYDLNGAQIYSKIDVKDAYSTLPLDDESSLLFTFSTPWGLYRLLRLVMGVTVSADVYQKYMTSNFQDIEFTKCFIDDFLIFGKPDADKVGTPEAAASAIRNHDEALEKTLQRCSELGLTLNEKKCFFGVEEVDFYGNSVSIKGFKPLRNKVDAFMKSKDPTNKKELRSFMGTCAHLIKRLPELAELAKPLNELRKKFSEFIWTPAHSAAVASIKENLVTGYLAHFDQSRETDLFCDAGPNGVAAVLTQRDKQGQI